jgi:hypothetical protein
MGFFRNLFSRAEQDLHSVFEATKRASVVATNDVHKARQALEDSLQRAVDLAEQTRASAEAAANKAQEDARLLAIEAKAAAEAVAQHRAQLTERQEPQL